VCEPSVSHSACLLARLSACLRACVPACVHVRTLHACGSRSRAARPFGRFIKRHTDTYTHEYVRARNTARDVGRDIPIKPARHRTIKLLTSNDNEGPPARPLITIITKAPRPVTSYKPRERYVNKINRTSRSLFFTLTSTHVHPETMTSPFESLCEIGHVNFVR